MCDAAAVIGKSGVMATLDDLMTRVRSGEVVVIDGGTGTEIQRQGVAMDSDTWCAEANLGAPDVVRRVHESYIEAGAELVIANTFATSPFLFEHLGRLADLPAIEAAAVRLARQASAGRVPVAGSVSTMRPVVAGSDRNDVVAKWPAARARELAKVKVGTLAEAGVDLLVMEMMRDTDDAVVSTEEAMATGLPVWVGISVERGADGQLTGWGRSDCRAADVIDGLAALGPQLMSIMHSSPHDTAEAIALLRERWDGPIGVYPESGFFAMPDWVFHDVIPPDELVAVTRQWIELGARVVGGCCGITPEHINALAGAFGRRPGI
jgi:homocysteine S-methyltransferase